MRSKLIVFSIASLSVLILSIVSVVGVTLTLTSQAYGSDDLQSQLQALTLPENQAPAGVNQEKLYAVQERNLPLKYMNEFSVGGALNLSGNSFLSTRQMELGYRFHFSDRWSAGIMHSFVSNSFTTAAKELQDREGIVPDVDYVNSRSELTVAYNLFYGKFRISMDQVFYFDQYVALGGGKMSLVHGDQNAAIADAGFAFWLPKWKGNIRLGLKDYLYNEKTMSGEKSFHNLHAHLDVGYLF